MKLPRWLVFAMLASSMLSVLAAAGWWWVTWPERTAREFLRMMSVAEFMQAEKMLGPGAPEVVIESVRSNAGKEENGRTTAAIWKGARIEQAKPRRLRDFALARQDFEYKLENPSLSFVAFYDITTERGKIVTWAMTRTIRQSEQ